MTDEIAAFIEADRRNLMGDFCRGCGYCMPCTVGIQINNCARMSQLIRRAPSENFLSEEWQANMMQIEQHFFEDAVKNADKFIHPDDLDLIMDFFDAGKLRKNLADYKDILAGKVEL